MKKVTVHSGDIIFRQKDFGRNMFDIVSGKVGIYTDYGMEQEAKIAELGKGETFGEMGMIENYPRSATAVALEDETVLNEIDEADLNEYFRDKPEKLLQLMKQLSRRLRETTDKYMEVCRIISELKEPSPEEKEIAALRRQMETYAMIYQMDFLS